MNEKENKYLRCTRCNRIWNVSIDTKYTEETYICPSCEGRLRRIEAANKTKKGNKNDRRTQ